MSCYKCHFRGKSADFQSETADFRFKSYLLQSSSYFFNSIFFLLLTFFILNRNSFTFGSYTLVTVRPNPNVRLVTMGQTEQQKFVRTVRQNRTFARSLCPRYPQIFICFFVLKHNYYFGFASLGLALAVKAAVGSSDDGGKRQKMRLFVHFLMFFFHLSRHQRDHIILNTFWQCTARFTSGENQLTSDQKQLTSGQKQLTFGHRRVVEEHISSQFSFSLFLFL